MEYHPFQWLVKWNRLVASVRQASRAGGGRPPTPFRLVLVGSNACPWTCQDGVCCRPQVEAWRTWCESIARPRGLVGVVHRDRGSPGERLDTGPAGWLARSGTALLSCARRRTHLRRGVRRKRSRDRARSRGPVNKESWAPQARELAAAGFRVLAIDFRGYGESKGPGQSDPLSAPLHFDVLAAVRHLRSIGARSALPSPAGVEA